MVDHIKFNKILPSLSPARKVVRTGSRGRNKQGTPFEENLERKQKKKKKDNSDVAQQPESEISLTSRPPERQADIKPAARCSRAGKSVRSKLIDIRV
jgi:hypothetical protein